jgi:hypothetical protein
MLAGRPSTWFDGGVVGAVVIVVILLLMPVVIIMSMALVAALIGWVLKSDVDSEFQDSEYLELGA